MLKAILQSTDSTKITVRREQFNLFYWSIKKKPDRGKLKQSENLRNLFEKSQTKMSRRLHTENANEKRNKKGEPSLSTTGA